MSLWSKVATAILLWLAACNSPSAADLAAFADVADGRTDAASGIADEVLAVGADAQRDGEGLAEDGLDGRGDLEVGAAPCQVDGDCVEPRRCDLLRGICVECLDYIDCDDDNVCTFDFCGGDGFCVNKPAQAECDDLDPCTLGDHCEDGACVFDSALDCDDGNSCTKDLCQGSDCYHGNLEGPCDDGDPCSLNDYCKVGFCTGGAGKLQCGDQNPCTIDTCVPFAGCQFEPSTGECDDGDLCTGSDHCSNGQCAGQPLDCDDGDACTLDGCSAGLCTHEGPPADACEDSSPCTLDSCDPTSGLCIHSPVAGSCDDGNLCTSNDGCSAGSCVGSAKDCDDDNDCTVDGCDPDTGMCGHQNLDGPCDDGNLCTLGDTCADGFCQPGSGFPDCEDGNGCTGATCDPKVGCINDVLLGWPCDDGDGCTANDVCVIPATCVGEPVVCQDDDPCTADSCVKGSGECIFVVAPGATCDDGNICTKKDVCQDDGTCAGVAKVCDDLDPCTTDSCEPGVGCVNTPHGGPC